MPALQFSPLPLAFIPNPLLGCGIGICRFFHLKFQIASAFAFAFASALADGSTFSATF
jgi:hypothetical protein